MRTVQEILASMSSELRCNALKAVDESRIFAATLAQIPSPSVLNGSVSKPQVLARYGDGNA